MTAEIDVSLLPDPPAPKFKKEIDPLQLPDPPIKFKNKIEPSLLPNPPKESPTLNIRPPEFSLPSPTELLPHELAYSLAKKEIKQAEDLVNEVRHAYPGVRKPIFDVQPWPKEIQEHEGKIPSVLHGVVRSAANSITPENLGLMGLMIAMPEGVVTKLASGAFGLLMGKNTVETALRGDFTNAIKEKNWEKASKVAMDQLIGVFGTKEGLMGVFDAPKIVEKGAKDSVVPKEGVKLNLHETLDRVFKQADRSKDLPDLKAKVGISPDLKDGVSAYSINLSQVFNRKGDKVVRDSIDEMGKIIKETPSRFVGLTELESTVSKMSGPKKSISERLDIGAEISSGLNFSKDVAMDSYNKIKGMTLAVMDSYYKPSEWTDFKDMLGKYLGGRAKYQLETKRFSQAIQEKIPDRIKQEAITNWIQADGNPQVLMQRASLSRSPDLKKGYEQAMSLSDEELALALDINNYHKTMFIKAKDADVLEHGIENYVKQQWVTENEFSNKILAEINSGLLKKNPKLAMHRVFGSYFEGEQAGKVPFDKRVGYQVGSYNNSLNEAILARGFIKSLPDGKAGDGRPLASVSGMGKTLPKDTAVPEVHLIRSKFKPEEAKDYGYIDHPALRGWKWAGNDPEGNPILVEGQLIVHPEIYDHLKNALSTSKLSQTALDRAIASTSNIFKKGGLYATKGVLYTSGAFKSTLLSFSMFHQTQVGFHATFHKVNPFEAPDINLDHPTQLALVEHGLMVYDRSGLQDFMEGNYSTSLVNRLPIVGAFHQKYGEYLFEDYIPRLKMKTAMDVLERNIESYKGKLNEDQILEITANQANAAFGEMNYKMMGRNPTLQSVLRLILLAPDFLEARAKFVGQALTPFGKEQRVALIRGALGMYTGARIFNTLLDGDPHWDKPFSVVYNGREYTLRSIPGDLFHLVTKPRSFIYHRLNPAVTRTAIEALTGRDEFGRKRDFSLEVYDFFRTLTPIPMKGFLKGNDQGIWDSLLASLGVSSARVRRRY